MEVDAVKVRSSTTEVLESGLIRLTVILDPQGEPPSGNPPGEGLGEGPTGDAIPDRIVKYLIERAPDAVSLSEIQAAVGGNVGTVNRQAWTLATNAPDLQLRLRGWVVKVDRGRYTLSGAARASLGV